MDTEMILVLAMMLAALVFLVYAERNSRLNEAKLEAELRAKTEPDPSSEKSLEGKSRPESKTPQSA
jgi:hypothetical protein